MSLREIADYYDRNQSLYNFFWSKDALHVGFWDNNTTSLAQAITNENKFIAECLDINSGDTVLDAGCGIGGTAIYIAKNYRAKVVGITISERQLEIAKKRAKDAGVDSLTFEKKDFTKTGFPKCFTKVFGIESICHAENKLDFLKEARRIMKKGKIAIADAFVAKESLTQEETKKLFSFTKGLAVPNLSTLADFRKDMEKAGFKNIVFHDKKNEVEKSSQKLYTLGILYYPLSFLLYRTGFVTENMHGNAISGIAQRWLSKNDVLTYGVFVGESL
jgi:tocopherol O-methyltransferase